ncbi:MAG: immunity protein TriTu family protein [Nostoc sp.]
MSSKPLTNLISGRNFDRFQPGLESRFAAYRLEYVLIYCEISDNPAMRLDFETSKLLGRVTVWESGDCDMEVIDIASGEYVFLEHHQFSNELEFHKTYPKLVVFMRDAFGNWSSAKD